MNVYDSEHKKKVEGKLEIKLRVKEALGQSKASELSSQRWLVIDRFEDIVSLPAVPATRSLFGLSLLL